MAPSEMPLRHGLELADRKRRCRGVANLDDPLAQTRLLQLQSAVMAIRVVARRAEQGMRRPGAAAAAGVGIIAGAAEAPEIVDRAQAPEADRIAVAPDVGQREIADVAAAEVDRRQRGDTL